MSKKPTNIFKMYWNAYGGFHAFWASYYFLIPLIITFFCSNHWLNNKVWINDPLTILPSLLGFTLAGYAMWLSVGNEKLKILLSSKFNKKNNDYSLFMQINASFIHFVIFQIVTLIFVYFLKYNDVANLIKIIEDYYILYNSTYAVLSFLGNLFYAIGFFLFIYSIFTMLATVLGIFRISFWIDSHNRKLATEEQTIKCPDCYGNALIKAKKCMHCGCDFESINSDSNPS
ncbi:hypothetical protein D9K79_08100 [Acinetobacter cumulans]|uniref:Zinc ribbon domain-containing protein n=1 Tax=Acinetobacter cumulans TaxID=2136182 RepID=A0ABX9U774_9GAMM|nr:hypothetical protein [Acinetobacter cumulans]RLL46404.1 hypothetical protein D9K79_08100 [Acinetobacter cumulans]